MAKPNEPKERKKSGFTPFQVALLVLCALLFQRILQQPNFESQFDGQSASKAVADASPSFFTPLSVPEGEAQNLPSVRVTDKALEHERSAKGTKYGGEGDKAHLGGFTEIDMQGISPAVWEHVVEKWTVQSVIDVGCGRGISTSWFVTHGLRTRCVEGSHDAIKRSMVPDKSILTEHDFSRGPWWPGETFDMAWSVEFLEHVNLQFHYNYISTFRKAAILLVTSSRWGGWHHVEVHSDDWWIRKYNSYGFVYDDRLTKEIRQIGRKEVKMKNTFPPLNQTFNAQHVWTSIKVFVNPAVAGLKEHAHLFGEFGCYKTTKDGNIIQRECNKAGETPLDPSFYPLKLTEAQDQAWYDIVKANVKVSETK